MDLNYWWFLLIKEMVVMGIFSIWYNSLVMWLNFLLFGVLRILRFCRWVKCCCLLVGMVVCCIGWVIVDWVVFLNS